MTQGNDHPVEAPELAAMHIEDETGAHYEPVDADVRRIDAADDDDPYDIDIEAGEATARDLAMAEDELADQGEFPAADLQ